MAEISRLILESIRTVTASVERDELQLNRNQCRHLLVCLKQVKDYLFSKPVRIYRRLLERIRHTVEKVEIFVSKCNNKEWLVNALSIGVSEEETKDLVLELKWGLDTHFFHSQNSLATSAGQAQLAAPHMSLPSEEDIRQDKKCLLGKLQVFLSRTRERHKKQYLAVYLQGRLKVLEEASRRGTEAGVNHDFDERNSLHNLPDLEHILWKPKLPEPSRHHPLGQGGSALVYKTSWLGVPCAQKSLFAGKKFGKEAGILATLNHPNIVTLYCCYEDTKSQSLIMELMDGSLFDLLKKHRESRNGSPFDLEEAVEIILQIVKGMWYLHRKGFAHRDLKSLNILVSKTNGVQTRSSGGDFVVKVADFELVKLFDPTCSNLLPLTRNVGSYVWRAPELLGKSTDDQKVNGSPRRADIYSFAMVCYEILSGEIPFEHCGLENQKLLDEVVQKGRRPPLAEDWPVELRALIERCWHADCARRPAFHEIYDQLLTFRSSLMSGTPIVVTEPLQHVEESVFRRALKMCRKVASFSKNAEGLDAYSTLQQATKEQGASKSIDSKRGGTSESMTSEGNGQTSELRTGTRLEPSPVLSLIPEGEDIPLQSSVEVLGEAVNPAPTELNPLNSRSEVNPQVQGSQEDLTLLQVIHSYNAGTLKGGKRVFDYSEGALKTSEGDSERVAANVRLARQSTKTRLAGRTTKIS